MRVLSASSSPKRKMGLERPSRVSSGRNAAIPAATADGLRASASSIGSKSSSGVPL